MANNKVKIHYLNTGISRGRDDPVYVIKKKGYVSKGKKLKTRAPKAVEAIGEVIGEVNPTPTGEVNPNPTGEVNPTPTGEVTREEDGNREEGEGKEGEGTEGEGTAGEGTAGDNKEGEEDNGKEDEVVNRCAVPLLEIDKFYWIYDPEPKFGLGPLPGKPNFFKYKFVGLGDVGDYKFDNGHNQNINVQNVYNLNDNDIPQTISPSKGVKYYNAEGEEVTFKGISQKKYLVQDKNGKLVNVDNLYGKCFSSIGGTTRKKTKLKTCRTLKQKGSRKKKKSKKKKRKTRKLLVNNR